MSLYVLRHRETGLLYEIKFNEKRGKIKAIPYHHKGKNINISDIVELTNLFIPRRVPVEDE